MGSYSTVDCSEEHDTLREDFDIKSGGGASVTLRCAWADRHALAGDILTNSRPWPHAIGINSPRAISAGIVPAPTNYEQDGQCIVYEHALVTVNYSHEIKDLISESLEPTAEFLTLDHREFRWSSQNGTPVLEGEAPAKLLRGCNLVRTLYQVPSPLPVELLTLQGHVNDAVYTSQLLGGLQFDDETLLFNTPQLSRTIKATGDEGWNIVLKNTYKAEGWNKFWRSATQSYEEMYHKDSADPYKNYPLGSFSQFLF